MSFPEGEFQETEISEFQNELERKDLIIKNLQKQLLEIKTDKTGSQGDFTLLKDLKSESARKDKEIQNLRDQILDLNTELKESKTKLNTYELKENFDKNESSNLLEISHMKIDQMSKDKEMLEDKIKQLIDIIKQYSNELNDSSLKIKSLNDEIFSLQNKNRKLIDERENTRKNV